MRKMERATGIEPVLPTWEGKYSALYFQHLQNRSRKMHVHALHTVHAVPDLRIAAGRFAGRFSILHLKNHPCASTCGERIVDLSDRPSPGYG